MFGIYRTVLAVLVVASHLGPLQYMGAYAVFAFYVLSGYLMTAILHKDYGYTMAGFGRYALNRGLRILPMYWLAVLCAIGVIAACGEAASRAYHGEMGLVLSGTDIARNLFLVLENDTPTRWVPPAWALTVELFFYGLIGLGLSRWRWVTLLWFGVSLAYTGYLFFGGASFSYRYYSVAAASLPFAMGAGVFHLRQWRQQQQRTGGHAAAGPAPWRWALPVLFAANLAWVAAGSPHALQWQFYANVALAAGMTWLLADWRHAVWRRHDTLLGNLSYPVYLLHYQAGLAVLLMGYSGQRGDWAFFGYGLAITLVASWALAAVVDPMVEAVRGRVRGGGPAASAARAAAG